MAVAHIITVFVNSCWVYLEFCFSEKQISRNKQEMFQLCLHWSATVLHLGLYLCVGRLLNIQGLHAEVICKFRDCFLKRRWCQTLIKHALPFMDTSKLFVLIHMVQAFATCCPFNDQHEFQCRHQPCQCITSLLASILSQSCCSILYKPGKSIILISWFWAVVACVCVCWMWLDIDSTCMHFTCGAWYQPQQPSLRAVSMSYFGLFAFAVWQVIMQAALDIFAFVLPSSLIGIIERKLFAHCCNALLSTLMVQHDALL